MNRQEVLAQIQSHKIVAILRLDTSKHIAPVIDALISGGIHMIEISMNTPDCLQQLAIHSQRKDLLLGVGTITKPDIARQAIENGARFVVTPVSQPSVIEVSHQYEVPVLSGALTPTEAYQAIEWGADMVKLFPAGSMGINYFKAIRAPFPDIPFIPTGGITTENMKDWLHAGAQALGVGSSLTPRHAIEKGNFQDLTHYAKDFVEELATWKAQ